METSSTQIKQKHTLGQKSQALCFSSPSSLFLPEVGAGMTQVSPVPTIRNPSCGRLPLATLGTHWLRDGGTFRNRFVRDSSGQRREQQRNVMMADDLAELPFGNRQPRPNPAFDLIAGPPELDVAANRSGRRTRSRWCNTEFGEVDRERAACAR